MDSIRIENLRSLVDTKSIELKPLTLLLGSNSTGKSTFLRTFPLLRQSAEARTRGPILWYGDYTDFGSFDVSVNNKADNITLHFGVKMRLRMARRIRSSMEIDSLENSIDLSLNLKSTKDHGTFVSKVQVEMDDQTFSLNLNSKGEIKSFKVNESDFTEYGSKYKSSTGILGLVPTISVNRHIEELNPYLYGGGRFEDREIHQEVFKFVKKRVRKGSKERTINSIINSVRINNKTLALEDSLEASKFSKVWDNKIKDWNLKSADFQLFNDMILATKVPVILQEVNEYITESAKNSHYVAPLRATAQRYYRRQDLAITEVDFEGRNLAMFIDNMSKTTLQKFQEWVSTFFDLYPATESSAGHISLRLIDKQTGENFNIADRGFGYSQILPVITMLWSVVNGLIVRRRRRFRSMPIIIAIEQPELHLHPALQAKLTDAFIAVIKLAKDNNINLKLVIETHSSAIINRIGQKIDNKEFGNNQASILMFEQLDKGATTVKEVCYNEEGYVENWPYGFFEPKD